MIAGGTWFPCVLYTFHYAVTRLGSAGIRIWVFGFFISFHSCALAAGIYGKRTWIGNFVPSCSLIHPSAQILSTCVLSDSPPSSKDPEPLKTQISLVQPGHLFQIEENIPQGRLHQRLHERTESPGQIRGLEAYEHHRSELWVHLGYAGKKMDLLTSLL